MEWFDIAQNVTCGVYKEGIKTIKEFFTPILSIKLIDIYRSKTLLYLMVIYFFASLQSTLYSLLAS